jgi:sugar lactone lactonase YvrE
VAGLYTVACARALAGDGPGMRAALHRLAGLRVYFDLAADDDFAALRAGADYATARAELEAVRAPHLAGGAVAFTLPERDLLTEGLARDPRSGDFFVSSVRKRKIVRVTAGGRVRDFVSPGRDGLWAVFALAVDDRRRALYALSAPVPEMSGYDPAEAGATGLFEYDLDSAGLRRKVLLPPSATAPRAFNDLLVGPGGTVYIGDGRSGALVTLAPGAAQVTPWLPAGPLSSAQGLTLTPSGRALYVADYGRGIARVDLASGAVRFLGPPPDTALAGIDGLVADGTTLVATQNGLAPHRVLRLHPDAAEERFTAAEVLAINDPRLDEPTLGLVVGRDYYYIANSQWSHFGPAGPRTAELHPPTVLKLRLP